MADDPALGEALRTVVTIGAEMNRRVVSINDHVAGMSRLAEAAIAEVGSSVTPTGQADLIGRLGRDLEDAAGRFAVDVDALEGAVAAIDEAMTVVFRAADALGQPDQPARAEANDVLTSIARFADPAGQGAGGFRVFENSWLRPRRLLNRCEVPAVGCEHSFAKPSPATSGSMSGVRLPLSSSCRLGVAPVWRTSAIRRVAPERMPHHGDHGEEEAPASPFVHTGVQGGDRRRVSTC